MAAKLIALTDSRRNKPVRKKLKVAKGTDILSLCDARRLNKCKESGESLKGRGFPLDHLVGPDEPSEGFGFMPPQENMNWLKRIMEKEDEKDSR
jgi:hypothetical protein